MYSDEKRGVLLSRCNYQNGGSPLLYVHVPYNPAVDRLSPSSGDRLSWVVPTLRTIKSVKTNFCSQQFQVNRAKGSYNGVSSLSLTRKFDITSDLLSKAETVSSIQA